MIMCTTDGGSNAGVLCRLRRWTQSNKLTEVLGLDVGSGPEARVRSRSSRLLEKRELQTKIRAESGDIFCITHDGVNGKRL